MVRPCFLVVDREHAGSLSTRKLVIETAKLNVITAYSGKEALATFQRFPNVDGVVLDAALEDMTCSEVVQEIKKARPSVPVLVVGVSRTRCEGADHGLESFDPAKLLTLLRSLNADAHRLECQDEEQQRTEQRKSAETAR